MTHIMTITYNKFVELTRPLVGLSISHSHINRNYSTPLFLEVGKLSKKYYRYRNGREIFIIQGKNTFALGLNWRVERPRSIYFGSFNKFDLIKKRLLEINNTKIRSISVEGRLPELVIELSNGLWIHSFHEGAVSETQPTWYIAFHKGRLSRKLLLSRCGKLVSEDATNRRLTRRSS
jgi:hypothetical protein